MDMLIKAVRAKLIGDTTLATIVDADDITSTFNAEDANYPCIVLGIEAGGSIFEISGVTRATLTIDVYSNINKKHLWTIYNCVKALLHNQERSITDTSSVIHVIYEAKVSDNRFDRIRDVWRLTAQYEVLYSTIGLGITTGVDGVVYADADSVNAVPSKEIAKFRGQVSLDISFESEVRSERERFGKTVYYHTGIARLSFEEMMFSASVLSLLWSITTTSSGTLNDGVTLATTYRISQDSYPSYLQVLFQMTKTDDGRKLEIEAGRAVCESLSIPFSRTDFSIFNCMWTLLGDASGNVVKIAVEN